MNNCEIYCQVEYFINMTDINYIYSKSRITAGTQKNIIGSTVCILL